MPTVSIITAAPEANAGFIAEMIASVAAQTVPSGWDLEWVVQEDGKNSSLTDRLSEVPFLRYASNECQLGIAATRNIALERANGALLQILDPGSLLLPGAISSLIPHFVSLPIHWAAGQAADLLSDGSLIEWESLIPTGYVRAGTVNDYAIEHDGDWPLHCGGLMLRPETVRAVGGWAASPAYEDIIMFSTLSELCDGFNEPAITWLHDQRVAQVAPWREQNAVGRHIALQRIRSVRALRMKFVDPPSLDLVDTHCSGPH